MLAREELSFFWGRNQKESGMFLNNLEILTGINQLSSRNFGLEK
jgi:hypothetical protein